MHSRSKGRDIEYNQSKFTLKIYENIKIQPTFQQVKKSSYQGFQHSVYDF